MTTAAECAKHLFISERRFREKLDLGIIERRPRGAYDLDAVREQYLAHLCMVADRLGDDAPDLARERARLASEQADAQAMKNTAMRANLLKREDVQIVWSASAERVRAKLSALPAKLAPLAYGRASIEEVRNTLMDGVLQALAELSATKVVKGEPQEQGGDRPTSI